MSQGSERRRNYYMHCLAVLLVAGGVFHVAQYALVGRRGPVRPLAVSLKEFPADLGDAHAVATGLSAEIEEALRLQDYWAATYVDSRQRSLALFIGYYADESIGKLHQPTVCGPAAGWTTVKKDLTTLGADAAGGQGMEVNRILRQKGFEQQIVLYWFHLPEGVVADPVMAKWERLRRLLHGNVTRSIVKVQMELPMTGALEETMDVADAFARLVEERLRYHLGKGWDVPVTGVTAK